MIGGVSDALPRSAAPRLPPLLCWLYVTEFPDYKHKKEEELMQQALLCVLSHLSKNDRNEILRNVRMVCMRGRSSARRRPKTDLA